MECSNLGSGRISFSIHLHVICSWWEKAKTCLLSTFVSTFLCASCSLSSCVVVCASWRGRLSENLHREDEGDVCRSARSVPGAGWGESCAFSVQKLRPVNGHELLQLSCCSVGTKFPSCASIGMSGIVWFSACVCFLLDIVSHKHLQSVGGWEEISSIFGTLPSFLLLWWGFGQLSKK